MLLLLWLGCLLETVPPLEKPHFSLFYHSTSLIFSISKRKKSLLNTSSCSPPCCHLQLLPSVPELPPLLPSLIKCSLLLSSNPSFGTCLAQGLGAAIQTHKLLGIRSWLCWRCALHHHWQHQLVPGAHGILGRNRTGCSQQFVMDGALPIGPHVCCSAHRAASTRPWCWDQGQSSTQLRHPAACRAGALGSPWHRALSPRPHADGQPRLSSCPTGRGIQESANILVLSSSLGIRQGKQRKAYGEETG